MLGGGNLLPPLANSVADGDADHAALERPDWACVQHSQSRRRTVGTAMFWMLADA
ncbi:hypothetical protein N182_37570 [Sinorhizobium sp. GL2]|nr:hypothetical protein N182_37570 [Sinorhizobium sp. GL2]